MAIYKEVQTGRIFTGRLNHGADLLEELTAICRNNNIALGRIEAIGAMQKAVLGFYNQEQRAYEFIEVDKATELTCLIGNVSIKDGLPMIHAHITLAFDDGRTTGGHLAPGTIIFACEFVIQELTGAEFERWPDTETGLPLWKEKNI